MTMTAVSPSHSLVASDLMTATVFTIPADMPLSEALRLLSQNKIARAPIVEADGRYLGILCAEDFDCCVMPSCPYRVEGRLLTGGEAVICTLDGGCPWQTTRPMTGGRHTEVCVRPPGVLSPWETAANASPANAVRHFMSTDAVTVGPQASLRELVRKMVDTGVQQMVVVDENEMPLGVVSASDIIAAIGDNAN